MNFHSAFNKGQSQISTNRVLRGGSWNNNNDNIRCANRNNNNPNNDNNNNGFRLSNTIKREFHFETGMEESKIVQALSCSLTGEYYNIRGNGVGKFRKISAVEEMINKILRHK